MTFKKNLPEKSCRARSRAATKNDREYWQSCRIDVGSRDVSYMYVDRSRERKEKPEEPEKPSASNSCSPTNKVISGIKQYDRCGQIGSKRNDSRRDGILSENHVMNVEIGLNIQRNRTGDRPTDSHYDRYNRTWVKKKCYTSRYPDSLRKIAIEQGAAFAVIETDLSHDVCVSAETMEQRRRHNVESIEKNIIEYDNNEERAAARRAEQRKQAIMEQINKIVELKKMQQNKCGTPIEKEVDSIIDRIENTSVNPLSISGKETQISPPQTENKVEKEIDCHPLKKNYNSDSNNCDHTGNDKNETNRNNANNIANRINGVDKLELCYHALEKQNIIFKKETPVMYANKSNVLKILNENRLIKNNLENQQNEKMDVCNINANYAKQKFAVEYMDTDVEEGYDNVLDNFANMGIEDVSMHLKRRAILPIIQKLRNGEDEPMDVDFGL